MKATPSQRIAVVGGVAAGPAAAAEAKRCDPAAEVTLYERGSEVSYGACEIPYFVGGQITSAGSLVAHSPAEFERKKGVSVRTRTEVTSLNVARRHLVVRDHADARTAQVPFDKLILATGAEAIPAEFEGCGAENVFTVRDISDATRLRRAAETIRENDRRGYYSRRVAIVGGGYIGLEIAYALQQAGHPVVIFQPGGVLLPGYLNPALGSWFTARVRQMGQVRDDSVVSVVMDPAGRVEAVRTQRGELLACSIVVVATGIRPNTALARASGVDVGASGAVRVSAGMKTSAPRVWACGDCVEVKRIPDGARVYAPLATTAFRTARVAARNAVARGRGTVAEFPGVTPASAVSAFGIEAASVGLQLKEAQEMGVEVGEVTITHTSRAGMLPDARPLLVSLVYNRNSGRLLGGQLAGDEGAALRANVLVPLIRESATVGDLASLDLVYNPPVGPSLDPLYVAARAAIRDQSVR